MNLGLADNLYEGGDSNKKKTDYSPFGKFAPIAQQQGWYQNTDPDANGNISYKSGYNSPFNDIIVDPKTQEKGYLSLIGGKNQKFDVVIKNKNGDIVHTIMSSATPDDVQTYLTNGKSNVAQRQQDIVKSNDYATTLFGF